MKMEPKMGISPARTLTGIAHQKKGSGSFVRTEALEAGSRGQRRDRKGRFA